MRLKSFLFYGFFVMQALLLFSGKSNAQIPVESTGLEAIDEAYASGLISLDEKVLQKFAVILQKPDVYPMFSGLIPNRHKCLTPTLSEFEQLKQNLSPATTQAIDLWMQSTVLQAAEQYVSPMGKFIILYENSGSNAVPQTDLNQNGIPDYVERAGEAADSSYRHQVLRLGYSDPIPEGFTYEITLADIGPFGFTQTKPGPGPRTRIVVENDFIGFPGNTDPEGDQLGALKVTIAHELKHAIQFVDNNWTGETDAWAEMDATLMEEVTYDNVNDYYNVIFDGNFGNPVFLRPFLSVIPGSYEHITWALFFHERIGSDFWPETWTRIRANQNLTMIDAVTAELNARGLQFPELLGELYLWHVHSGPVRGNADFGFKERLFYPNPFIRTTFNDIPDTLSREFILPPVSSEFFEFIPSSQLSGSFGLRVDVPRGLIQAAVLGVFSGGQTDVRIQSITQAGSSVIITDWDFSSLERVLFAVSSSSTIQAFEERGRFAFKIVNADAEDVQLPETITLFQNFPNPFNPGTTIRFQLSSQQNVELLVYDAVGRLVQTLASGNFSAGVHDIRFDATGLASGLYFYELRTGSSSKVEKMLLVK